VPASCSRRANDGTIVVATALVTFRREQLVRTYTRRSRVARLWAVLAALLIVPATLAVSTAPAGAAASNTLTVKASEYTYVLKGKPKGGWVQINFVNAGVEQHMMVVFKLKPGTTNKQFEQALMSNDDSALGAVADLSGGDPTLGGTPALLGAGEKTTTLTKMPAGTYGLACFVPAPDGRPHAMHGMAKVVKVKGRSSVKPPKDGVHDVTLSDTTITVPSGNAPKHVTLKVTNEGTTPHSFDIVRLADGKTLDEVKTYYDTFFSTGALPEGDPPGVLVGGVESVPSGGTSYVEWSLPAGSYAYVSTDGDAPNDDYAKGLHGTFTIS
jgi:hypothetical protein